MLSYKKKLRVSAEEIYDLLVQQVIAEARQKGGKDFTVEDFNKGLKYKSSKKLSGKLEDASVSVKKPIENRKISFTYFIKGVTYDFSYNITPEEDGTCTLEYNQTSNPAQKENWFARLMNNRNSRAKFSSMEKYIIQNRNKQNNEE